ncbi:MAG: ATP-binding protein [Pyrinomonadaceae bacterium]
MRAGQIFGQEAYGKPMGHLSIFTRDEIESLGPPIPEELLDTGVSDDVLRDLALKHLARLVDPNSVAVAEKLNLPCVLIEELLYQLYREKLIEMRLQSSAEATRYAMLEHGWQRVAQLEKQCGYVGPAPVSLADYRHMMRLQAKPSRPASMQSVRAAVRDLVLPKSLLETVGCAINSRSSLFLSGPPGTGKTALTQRINRAVFGFIWIPYALEVDGEIIRIFDSHCHKTAPEISTLEHDRRWVKIERPLITVGGDLTLEHTALSWSDSSRFYEAPFQVKSNGGTLVIDDFGRQRVAPQDLLNRWILPLERHVDLLTLRNGRKIEFPFESLVVFSTNLEEHSFVDEAFLRRIAYRARIEQPSLPAYIEIFNRAASERGIQADSSKVSHLMKKYEDDQRPMRGSEPVDLLNRLRDICLFRGCALQLTNELIDVAWNSYFGAANCINPRQQALGTAAHAGPVTV